MDDLEDARRRYHFGLPPEDHERLPFYSALLEAFEHDELALTLLASVRAEQRNSMLVLASLHLVALHGHETLGPIYDAARHGTLEDPRGAAAAVLAEVHASPALVRDQLWRSTQTNEPGRSAVIQALVRELTDSVAAINLVEVGTSAGINLWFDQFPVRAVDDGHALTLICEDLTTVDRTRALPPVASRVGIDPNPLSLDDVDDRLWLKACIWPEEQRRHERFDAIVAAHAGWPATTRLKGRALEQLGDALAAGDRHALTIVVNTWVAFYFSPDEQRAYFDELVRRCANENVAWLSIESTLVTWPGVTVSEEAHHRGASQIVVARPGESPNLWGWCHAHGRWLEQAPPG